LHPVPYPHTQLIPVFCARTTHASLVNLSLFCILITFILVFFFMMGKRKMKKESRKEKKKAKLASEVQELRELVQELLERVPPPEKKARSTPPNSSSASSESESASTSSSSESGISCLVSVFKFTDWGDWNGSGYATVNMLRGCWAYGYALYACPTNMLRSSLPPLELWIQWNPAGIRVDRRL